MKSSEKKASNPAKVGRRTARRAALRKSLPLILTVEILGVLALAVLSLLYFTADPAALDRGFHPGVAPPVDWPEPEIFTGEAGAGFIDLPYEVSDGRGAVLLPDVYYADDFQNEQIMPTALALKLGPEERPYDYSINRLIYPTIGNPALVVRESQDLLRVVLRLRRPDYLHLAPATQPAGVAHAPHLNELDFAQADDRNRIAVYLLSRDRRNITESFTSAPSNLAGEIEIEPVARYRHDRSTVPLPLRGRDTIQLHFDAASLEKFKPGLYDLRIEIFRAGRLYRYEFQYNAVRIFEKAPERYNVLNITDSQVSLSDLLDGVPNENTFRAISYDKLKEFIQYARDSQDETIREAAFVTFNGDLHNGGSPGTLLPEDVALAYNREARRIVELLRELPLPIFLTPGNHDGYVSMGHVPGPIRLKVAGQFVFKSLWGGDKSLGEVVEEVRGEDRWQLFEKYLEATENQPGGWHRDIFTGRFVRRGRTDRDGALTWRLLPNAGRNQILYDGFYQWRRAYGPLFYSFRFGRSHYVVLNTYDIRQHRRSGWGMYTVNYGGGVSPFQMNWLRRDIRANEAAGRDITLIAHHDPRGGHNGEDYPYYFEMIEYTGMGESAINYVKGEILNPLLCGARAESPDWARSKSDVLSCMHDGLQEWMRADPDFDCADEDLFEEGPRAGFCDRSRFKSTTFEGNPRRPEYSGYLLLHRLAKHPSIRTLLLGHTHYNSLEILQPGDEIVPGKVTLDLTADKKYAKIEVQNPLRYHALEDIDAAEHEPAGQAAADDPTAESDADNADNADNAEEADATDAANGARQGELEKIKIVERDGVFVRELDLLQSGHDFERVLRGKELAILRMTSMADLSLQQFQGRPLYGFSVLEVYPHRDRRAYPRPQINRVHYYQAVAGAEAEAQAASSKAAGASGAFARVASVELERTKRWKRRGENPLLELFRLPESPESGENSEPAAASAPGAKEPEAASSPADVKPAE